MKLPFKKAKEPSKPEETLQSLQQEFNQVMFELGDLNYRKHMINSELSKINSEINTRTQKADDMGKRAAVLRQRAQEELAKTVKQGQTNAQEATKAS